MCLPQGSCRYTCSLPSVTEMNEWISNGFNVKYFKCHEKYYIITIQYYCISHHDKKERKRQKNTTLNFSSLRGTTAWTMDNVWQLGRRADFSSYGVSGCLLFGWLQPQTDAPSCTFLVLQALHVLTGNIFLHLTHKVAAAFFSQG